MGLPEDRSKLQKALGRLVAHREHFDSVRAKVQDRASQQLDTMPQAIRVAGQHVARGKGGVLSQRYLKTRLVEDARLRGVTVRREGRNDDR